MTTQARGQVKSEQGRAKGQGIGGCDIAGILMGLPLFSIGLFLALYAIPGNNYFGLVGAVLLLISVGLFIPSTAYEQGDIPIANFLAMISATAVSVNCGFFFGWMAYYVCREEDPTFALGGVLFAAFGLAAFAYALGCTFVLLHKVRSREILTIVAVAVGVVAGVLNMVYFPNF